MSQANDEPQQTLNAKQFFGTLRHFLYFLRRSEVHARFYPEAKQLTLSVEDMCAMVRNRYGKHFGALEYRSLNTWPLTKCESLIKWSKMCSLLDKAGFSAPASVTQREFYRVWRGVGPHKPVASLSRLHFLKYHQKSQNASPGDVDASQAPNSAHAAHKVHEPAQGEEECEVDDEDSDNSNHSSEMVDNEEAKKQDGNGGGQDEDRVVEIDAEEDDEGEEEAEEDEVSHNNGDGPAEADDLDENDVEDEIEEEDEEGNMIVERVLREAANNLLSRGGGAALSSTGNATSPMTAKSTKRAAEKHKRPAASTQAPTTSEAKEASQEDRNTTDVQASPPLSAQATAQPRGGQSAPPRPDGPRVRNIEIIPMVWPPRGQRTGEPRPLAPRPLAPAPVPTSAPAVAAAPAPAPALRPLAPAPAPASAPRPLAPAPAPAPASRSSVSVPAPAPAAAAAPIHPRMTAEAGNAITMEQLVPPTNGGGRAAICYPPPSHPRVRSVSIVNPRLYSTPPTASPAAPAVARSAERQQPSQQEASQAPKRQRIENQSSHIPLQRLRLIHSLMNITAEHICLMNEALDQHVGTNHLQVAMDGQE